MNIALLGLTGPVALALVALLGYLVGRRRPSGHAVPLASMDDADALIEKIESISNQLRQSMATHHCTVSRCREQIRVLSESHAPDSDTAPHMHLQAILAPTDRLTEDIALAYDELRQHTHALARLRRTRTRR